VFDFEYLLLKAVMTLYGTLFFQPVMQLLMSDWLLQPEAFAGFAHVTGGLSSA
jgi:hypothetical protein